ncbi:MAG: hypothetical protein J6J04_00845 [Oscillospiraceae bacterium]|nr:hypothetical protein [Oscillospiraceae bacterium]
MNDFRIEIAKVVFCVKAQYQNVNEFCKEYLVDKKPDLEIVMERIDIAHERKINFTEQKIEGIALLDFPDPYYEITALQRKIAERFFEFSTLLFHGSVVALDGEAFLFTAKSGTGKSTHTRLWREVFGSRAVMINDDKPFLKINDDGVTVYGSPWNGKHRIGSNTSAPLKAICILERGTENHISEISAKEALPMLLQQSHRPMQMNMMPHYLDLIDQLSQKVRFYRLSCTMDPQAAVVAYEGMTNKGKEEV